MRQIRSSLKRYLERSYPPALLAYRELYMRWRRPDEVDARRSRARRLFGASAPSVLSGPFRGLRYLTDVSWGPIEARWLGTYEKELHPVIELIIRQRYDTIIDVGSAEGYYSVGLAFRLPDAKVYAFDTDPWSRAQQHRLVRLNDIRNVEIKEFCSSEELARRIAGKTLVICDIEGGEYDLLGDVAASALEQADILVELHARPDSGIDIQAGSALLQAHLAGTHVISAIAARPRELSDFPPLNLEEGFSDAEVLDYLNEYRMPHQVWLWAQARKGSAPPVG